MTSRRVVLAPTVSHEKRIIEMTVTTFSAGIIAIAASLLFVSPAAHAAWVEPSSVLASSSYPDSEGVSYAASNVADHKVSTVWVEGQEGSGLGSWVQLDFPEEREITSLTIWNGNWYSWDFWNRHNRAKEIEIELSDQTVHKFTLKDEKVPETISLPSAVRVSWLKIKIKGIYRGSTFNDTCISEVVVNDSRSHEFHQPSTVADSGHLPEDADGSYQVENTYDGILDTMWCENQKSGDGTGSWLEQRFVQPVSTSRMTLRNGNAYSISFWMKSNRAGSATLVFSDGSREAVQLKNSVMEQTVSFPSHMTSSVKVIFGDVTRGKEYNDLCMSELRFYE